MDAKRYQAFISYSHADERWASWLHRRLEGYSPPRHLVGMQTAAGRVPKKLTPVFRDREELASAADLGEKLTDALQNANALVVICSMASAQSRWVNEEILSYKRMGMGHRIFAIIVDGEPHHPEHECFPPALKFQLDKDGQLSDVPAEPIAADARTGKDGRRLASLKLIAGILDLGFDDLQQRELHRRQQRFAMIAAASFTGMVIAVGLMLAAVAARNDAQEQRTLAQREAEKARQTAAFMVDIFNVSDPSEARGRSITAREILQQGAQRIDNQLTDQPDVQAGLMETIGQVYLSLGLFSDATALLQKALATREQIEKKDQNTLARSHYLLAKVLTESAQYEQAEQAFIQALDLAQNESQKTDIRAALAEFYFRTGRYKEARPLLEQVLEHRTRVQGADDPATVDAMAELALNYFDQGDLQEADKRLQTVLALQQKIHGAQPHPDLGETLNNLGLIKAESGRLQEAQDFYQQSLAMNRTLYGEQHPAVAIGVNNLALLARRQGDYTQAEQWFLEALAIHQSLHGEIHPQIALVKTNLALTYEDLGHTDKAYQSLSEALTIQRQSLGEQDPQVARTRAFLGRLAHERGDMALALELQRSATNDLAQSLEASHPQLISARLNLAELLLDAGDLTQCDALLNAAAEGIRSGLPNDHWYHHWHKSLLGSLYSVRLDEQADKLLAESAQALALAQGVSPAQQRQAQARLTAHRQRKGAL